MSSSHITWCSTRAFPLPSSTPPTDLDFLLDVGPVDVPSLSLPSVLTPSSTPSAAPSPSTPPLRPPSSRFANPARIYQRRVLPGSSVPSFDEPPRVLTQSHDEPSVHNPVAIHRNPHHVHPMVTCRSDNVLHPIGRLVLATATTTPPSFVPSSVRSMLADPRSPLSSCYGGL